MRNIIIATAIAASCFALTSDANAQTVNISFAGSSAQQVLLDNIDKVCSSTTLVLSDKAMTACTTKQMPRLNNAGTGFINTGLGAEFNILIRQISK